MPSEFKGTTVTRPLLPSLEIFQGYLGEIWDRKWLTNNGPLHQELEQELCKILDVNYCSLVGNGTLALMLSLKALEITGEVITTPYSFVATSNSLKWGGQIPVFCDINIDDFSLNVEQIESLITSETSAILPVHVYGFPCNYKEIQQIANKHGLSVVYDAAHAFNIKAGGESLLKHGDVSVLSFHATKIFSTIEGGAIITNDAKIKERVDQLRNFGFDGSGKGTISMPGINAKMNEIQAAFGLSTLKLIPGEISKRKILFEKYIEHLQTIKGITCYPIPEGVEANYSYFPILINEKEYGQSRDKLCEALESQNIYPRKYFHPLISHLTDYSDIPSASPDKLPVAEKVSKEILCLPLHGDLETETHDKIIQLIHDYGKI